jgi:hypothetical protein
VLVAVAPQVLQESVGRRRPLVAPPGQGEDKLRRRLGAAAGGPGTLDSSFGTVGQVLTTNFQGDDIAEAVVVQPNGDIVAIGFSEDNTTGAVDAAARYLG